MKVKIIAFEFPPYRGGIANYSHALAKCLAKNGDEVIVYTLNVASTGDGYAIIRPTWKLEDSKVVIVRKALSIIYRLYQYFFFLRIVTDVCTASKSDKIIVTSLFFDFSRIAITFFRLIGVKYQIVLHGLDIYELPQTLPTFFRAAVRNAEKIIFNSKSTSNLFRSTIFKPENEIVIPPLLDLNWIDQIDLLDRESVRKEIGIPSDIKIILSVCRLVHRKGIDLAIKSMLRYLKDRPDVVYAIAGQGEQFVLLEQMVPEEFQKRIIFLGQISDRMKFSLLKHASVFLMPNRRSKSNVEGFGISFLEASYLKTWVVGGNSGGVPEAVDVSSNGYLVGDSDEAVNELYNVLCQIDTRMDEEALERGRQFVIDNFSLNRKLTI